MEWQLGGRWNGQRSGQQNGEWSQPWKWRVECVERGEWIVEWSGDRHGNSNENLGMEGGESS